MMFIIDIIAIVIAYLLGSINSSILVCKSLKLNDPRQYGSKNPGTTNVLRIGNKKAALLTLLGDIIKGLFATLMAKALGVSGFPLSLVALATFIGHLYPLFFQFKGGKGVATLIGCLLGLHLSLGVMAIITWVLIAFVFRYSSMAGVTMAVLAPMNATIFHHPDYLISLAIMALLLVVRHKTNINNLHHGKEQSLLCNKSQEKE